MVDYASLRLRPADPDFRIQVPTAELLENSDDVIWIHQGVNVSEDPSKDAVHLILAPAVRTMNEDNKRLSRICSSK